MTAITPLASAGSGTFDLEGTRPTVVHAHPIHLRQNGRRASANASRSPLRLAFRRRRPDPGFLPLLFGLGRLPFDLIQFRPQPFNRRPFMGQGVPQRRGFAFQPPDPIPQLARFGHLRQ